MRFMSQLGLDESKCIHRWGIEISQTLGFVLKQMNQRDEERNDLG